MHFVRALFAFSTLTYSVSAITIDMVTVGNPGNAPDTRYNSISVGAVANVYAIGKHEITAGQYTEFLNAVAKADPNGLYRTDMSNLDARGANIQQLGSSPNYSYIVAPDWANRPVNWVSFWDAARFANWLHNGQPSGPQGAGTTEDGAYHNIGNRALFGRNIGAKFFIPTEDEWYKAAYHKNDGTAAHYWNYPTASDSEPVNTLPDPGNHSNSYDFNGTGNGGLTIGPPYYRTEVGAFHNSASPYGTFDQGGNVWEWNESKLFSSSFGIRGGAFNQFSIFAIDSAGSLHATKRSNHEAIIESADLGFRIAAVVVPEPSAIVHIPLAFAVFVAHRRKYAPHNHV